MKKNFKKFVEENVDGVDKIIRHKDGTFSLHRGFFYRHGMTSEKWAEKVSDRLKEANVDFEVVKHNEHWAAWPKDSWFIVTVKVNSF